VQYFFADGDEQKGPFPLESLRPQGLKPDSLVWREGMSQWQRADSLAEVASVFSGLTGSPSTNPSNSAQGPAAAPYPSAPAYQAAPAYSPAATPTGLAYQQPGYNPGYALPPSNGMAVASMILGILSIPMMFAYCVGTPCAIVAIVLGHIARGKARRGEASGEGMALAGLICGYASLLLVGALIAIFAIFVGISAAHGH